MTTLLPCKLVTTGQQPGITPPSARILLHIFCKLRRTADSAPSDVSRIPLHRPDTPSHTKHKTLWPVHYYGSSIPQPASIYLRSPDQAQCSEPSLSHLPHAGTRRRTFRMPEHIPNMPVCRTGTWNYSLCSPESLTHR